VATSIQSESLSPFDQFQQLLYSVGSVFNSLCERTDAAFQRVHVMKKDENGSIKLYDVKDKITGETNRTAILTYIEDVKTGELYMDEEAHVVAFKCALVVLGMPFYTLGKMVWHAVKTPLEIGALALNILAEAGSDFAQGKLYEGSTLLRKGLIQSSEKLGNGVYEIIKSPIFGIGAAFGGICGVIKPFRGRTIEARVENAWQNGVSHKNDFRNIPPRAGENCLQAFFKDVLDSRPFYLAHCFQIRGNTHDPSVTVIRRSPV